ncbi:MAG: TapB family protein [Anaerolineales bacterium]
MKKPNVAISLLLLFSVLLAACGGGQATEEPAVNGQDSAGNSTNAGEEEPAGAGGQGLCTNQYFPVFNAATWTYFVSGAPVQDFSYTDTITNATSDGFTLSTNFALEGGLHRTQAWGCEAGGLVALEYTGGPSGALTTEGLVATFNTTGVSGVTIPADLAVGSTWTQTMDFDGDMVIGEGMSGTSVGSVSYAASAVGMESVSTTAGTFEAIKVEVQQYFNLTATVEGFSMPVTFTGVATVWYAPGVGMVKMIQTEDLFGSTTTVDLQSYSIP